MSSDFPNPEDVVEQISVEEPGDIENTDKNPESVEISADNTFSLDASETESDEEAGVPFNDTPEEILLSRLESLIFVYPEPITVRRLARILSLDGKRVRALVGQLQEHYENRGIRICEISGGFQFTTHPGNAEVVRTVTNIKPMKMSRPAIETLAIVAYKQPCTRAEVEDVRRVDCGGTLKFLFEKSLVRVLGRKEEPGRPIIYGTSSVFLELFNLKSLSDLPSLREFTELWDEHQALLDEEEPESTPPPVRNRELLDYSGLDPKRSAEPTAPPAPVDGEDEAPGEDSVEDPNGDAISSEELPETTEPAEQSHEDADGAEEEESEQ